MCSNRDYIDYLNSLHNYNAQNQNAYAERNVENEYYSDVMVKIKLCDFIVNSFSEIPHIVMLTGHAGDGKTSTMYQVFKELHISFNISQKITTITLSDGRKCLCVKDFSELSDIEKISTLNEILECPEKGQFVFLVANTGPLINTFKKMFLNEQDQEKYTIQLLNAMDESSGKINNIAGYPTSVINMASVDNTYFALEFLKKITNDTLWLNCKTCPKSSYCHMLRNKRLINDNKQQVYRFIEEHFTWLSEHGKRLTIRSITEQLAFMITGGYNCETVIPIEEDQLLFSNLFFGYRGIIQMPEAKNIIAIDIANRCGYDSKKLRADEELLITKNYKELFGDEVFKIVSQAYAKNAFIDGWAEFLRRTYMFLNIVTDDIRKAEDTEDTFSAQFSRYLAITKGKSQPNHTDVMLIADALSMAYIGTIDEGNPEIAVTLSKEAGLSQNVQLIIGTISERQMSVETIKTNDAVFGGGEEHYKLKLKINHIVLDETLSLPLIDYFAELRRGIIPTNIDPQLSHGVESIKAQISALVLTDDSEIELYVLRNDGYRLMRLSFDNEEIHQDY